MGASYAHVVRILNYTKLTITRLIQCYRVTGRTADRPRSRRPCVTTANEDRHLRICHLRNIISMWQTDLIVIDGNLTGHPYINQVLRPILLPFLQHQPRLFQQTMPDLTQLVWCNSSLPQTTSMFCHGQQFIWPVTVKTFVGSSWPANSTSS